MLGTTPLYAASQCGQYDIFFAPLCFSQPAAEDVQIWLTDIRGRGERCYPSSPSRWKLPVRSSRSRHGPLAPRACSCGVRYLEAMYGLGDGVEGRGAASALAQARSSMWMDWILYGGDFGPSFATANHRWAIFGPPPRRPPGEHVAMATMQDAKGHAS